MFDSDDITDRNCACCVHCCVDYAGWLQFQQMLYKIVRDPLFELFITVCIVLNTMVLALEHHGMSESVLRALDVGNKVRFYCTRIPVQFTALPILKSALALLERLECFFPAESGTDNITVIMSLYFTGS